MGNLDIHGRTKISLLKLEDEDGDWVELAQDSVHQRHVDYGIETSCSIMVGNFRTD